MLLQGGIGFGWFDGYDWSVTKEMSPYLKFFSKITSMFFALGIVLFYFKEKKRFAVCPHCNKSIDLKYDWTCDYCHNKQGKIRSLHDPCFHCGRELELVVCEHCDEEIGL